MSIREAAAQLEYSYGAIYKQIKLGRIPAEQFFPEGNWKIERRFIRELLKSHKGEDGGTGNDRTGSSKNLVKQG